MSTNFSADIKVNDIIINEQPAPTPGQQSVPDHVRQRFIQHLDARDKKGVETYGRSLQTHNGRNAHEDALDEIIDAYQYVSQALLENQDKDTAIRVLQNRVELLVEGIETLLKEQGTDSVDALYLKELLEIDNALRFGDMPDAYRR